MQADGQPLHCVPQGLDFAKDAMRDLEREHSDTQWHYFSTGHSLGALMATALAIDEEGKVERCATFESPGLIKFWRKRAHERGDEHWRSRIINYLTFPSASPNAARREACMAAQGV